MREQSVPLQHDITLWYTMGLGHCVWHDWDIDNAPKGAYDYRSRQGIMTLADFQRASVPPRGGFGFV
jgi:hypothetical protein